MLLGAIEGGGTKFICGTGTEDGQVLERISIPTTTPEQTLDRAMEYFAGKGIEALGVGTFGPVVVNPHSPGYGSVAITPKPHWSGFDILGYLSRSIRVPMGFDTDVNAAVLGETTWGAAAGLGNALYMTVGTGIGAGAIVEGRLVHGLVHPEMGHIVVRRHPDDRYAGRCPVHGDCFEGLAAGPAIEERWGRKAYELEESHPAWEWESHYLAQALVNFILILSPEKIILGGGVMNQPHLFPLVRKEVSRLLNGYIQHPAITGDMADYIVPPGLGGNAGFCGGLALARKALAGVSRL